MTARTMQFLIKPIATVSLLALTLGTAQAGITIDHFADNQLVRDPPDLSETSSSTLSGGNFIGASRDMTVDRNGADGSVYAASNSVNPEILVIGNSGSANGIVDLQWNAILDLDLTDGGAKGIFLAFNDAIDKELTISFEAFDGALSAVGSKTFANGSQGFDFFIPFDSFTNQTALASVNTLSARFTSIAANWDAGISFIETRDTSSVPVPGVLSLMAIGLTGLGFSRRRA